MCHSICIQNRPFTVSYFLEVPFMKAWQRPTTSFVLDSTRVEIARELSLLVKVKPSTSMGIRYALTQVHRDPRTALDWVIHRYGDPLPPQDYDKPVHWLPGMHNIHGAASGTVTVSGLTSQLKSVAHAFGYGTSSRGICYALDYVHLRTRLPVPPFISGEQNARPMYQRCTLQQHLEYYTKQYNINLTRLENMGTLRQEIQREVRAAKLGLGPPQLTPEELAEAGVTVQPSTAPGDDTGWLDAEPSASADSATTGDSDE